MEVLLVDDHQLFRSGLRLLLQELQHVAALATSAHDMAAVVKVTPNYTKHTKTNPKCSPNKAQTNAPQKHPNRA